jgi:hypothetical protein
VVSSGKLQFGKENVEYQIVIISVYIANRKIKSIGDKVIKGIAIIMPGKR